MGYKNYLIIISLIFSFRITYQKLLFLEDTYKIEINVSQTSPIEEIQPGMGYSSDSGSLAKTVCYKTNTVHKSGQSSALNFEQSLSYKTMLKTFNSDLDISGGYGIFTTNDLFKYFKKVEDDEYSLSVNYFQKVTDNVIMTFSYDPENILTDIGKSIYKNGENPMFRLLCGDTLITSYEEGAILIISYKFIFNSREEKETFDAKIGINLGEFVKVTSNINTLSNEFNLNGKIVITAFQMGGDPSQLSKLLVSSVVDCDIRKTDPCLETSKGLINYVSNIFPKQFDKDEHGIWTSPLIPLTQFHKDYLVSDFGLKLSDSFITPEVKSSRLNLIEMYKKFDYYNNHLHMLISNYPLKLDTNFNKFLQIIDNNLNLLLNGDGRQKAIDCFTFPFKCINIHKDLISLLDFDVENQINNTMRNMKFYSDFKFIFHDKICLEYNYHWVESWLMEMKSFPDGSGKFNLVVYPNDFNYVVKFNENLNNFNFIAENSDFHWEMIVNTHESTEDVYDGNFQCNNQRNVIQGKKLVNPLYFESYKN